jgi:hypothetical protein
MRKPFREGRKMNKAALTKNEIYNKLTGFSEKDLASIANFVDFMRHQKKLKTKKIIKLQGILKGRDIDLSELKRFKKQTWQHVDKEFADE